MGSALLKHDGEFMLAARYWNGGLNLKIDDKTLSLPVSQSKPAPTAPMTGGIIELAAPAWRVWDEVLAAVPKRFHNDVMANVVQDQGMERHADPVVFAQYFAAAARAIELLRPQGNSGDAMAHDLQPEDLQRSGWPLCSGRTRWRQTSHLL